NLPRVFSDGSDIEARAAVQLAAAWAGLAIENAMLGAAHALANPLTATHGIVHGQAVGLMLPHVVRYNAPACQAAYGELLAVAGGPATVRNASSDAAGALGDWLDGLLAAAGLARSLAGLVATDPDVPALAAAAASQWTAGFNPQPVTAAELTAIYEAAR
ncbi:MAG: iron-containing alcohol dehydrogenase, partial [Pirellulales bacterium]|nr:iron-containing alcohol dehydrogenase [Pirellulales bacterium]